MVVPTVIVTVFVAFVGVLVRVDDLVADMSVVVALVAIVVLLVAAVLLIYTLPCVREGSGLFVGASVSFRSMNRCIRCFAFRRTASPMWTSVCVNSGASF